MSKEAQKAQSPLDAYRGYIEQLVAQNLSAAAIASILRRKKSVETSDRSVRRALVRWGLTGDTPEAQKVRKPSVEEPNFELDGDDLVIRNVPSPILNTPEDLLLQRQMDPEDWEITNVKVNEWDSPTGDTLRQLTVNCKRKKPLMFVRAADMPVDFHVSTVRQPTSKADPFTVVFVGDQQAPYQDPHLHALFCTWLDAVRPERGVLIGDTVDFPDISRHPSNPEWHVPVQSCINSGYKLLREYVQSSETTAWQKLMGNHDERIRTRLLNLFTNLYGVRPAEIEGEEPDTTAYGIRHLLRLDSLGIDLIEPNGNYTHAQAKVSPYLAARHGWIAKKGSGASALATLEHLGFSVVVGHTHRQSRVHKTTHSIDGEPHTLTAVETGCMCTIKEGLGYTTEPDWQNGFATATVHPDGTFNLDLATYVTHKGQPTLLWRDERYVI